MGYRLNVCNATVRAIGVPLELCPAYMRTCVANKEAMSKNTATLRRSIGRALNCFRALKPGCGVLLRTLERNSMYGRAYANAEVVAATVIAVHAICINTVYFSGATCYDSNGDHFAGAILSSV